jgi:hypothetical protein
MLEASIARVYWRLPNLRRLRLGMFAGLILIAPGSPVFSQTLPVRSQANADVAQIESGGSVDIPVLANDVLQLGPNDAAPRLTIITPPLCGRAEVSPVDPRQIRYSDGSPGSEACSASTRSFVYEVQLQGRREAPIAPVTVTIGARRPPIPPIPIAPQPSGAPVACDVQGANFKMIRMSGGRVDKAAIPADLQRYASWLDDEVRTVAPACIMTSPVTYGEVRRFVEGLRPEERTHLVAEQLEPLSDDVAEKSMDARTAGGVSHLLAEAYAANLTARLGRTFSLPSLAEITAAALEANQTSNNLVAQLFGADVGRGRFEWTATSCPSGDNGFWTVGTGQNDKLGRFCFGPDSVDTAFAFRLIMRMP